MNRTAHEVAFSRPVTGEGAPDPLLLAAAGDSPVLRVAGPGEGNAWLVAREHAVREVLLDPDRFTNEPPAGFDDQRGYVVPLIGMDPPEHTRIRRLAAKAFTHRRIKSITPTIERAVDSLLDDMVRGGLPGDIHTSLARPLPLDTILGMVGGIPDDLRADVRRWSEAFTSLAGTETASIEDAVEGFQRCLRQIVTERRDNLGDDLMSDLIRARDDRDALSEDELVGLMALLIVAGYESTTRTITRGVMALLRHGLWPDLVSGDLPVSAAVEEVLRHQTPNIAIWRTAKVDTELCGMPIKAGEAVYVSTHLANFDPDGREEPMRFDPSRDDARHTTFGHGIHFCLGAPLARAQLSASFRVLSRRFPKLRLARRIEDLEWTMGSWLNSPTSLPVYW